MSEFLSFLNDCFGRRGYVERKCRKLSKKVDRLLKGFEKDLKRIDSDLNLKDMKDLKKDLISEIERMFR